MAIIGTSRLEHYKAAMARSYGTGKSAQDGDHTFHLYVRPKDPKAEQWDGARSGTQAAVDIFNADEVIDLCHEIYLREWLNRMVLDWRCEQFAISAGTSCSSRVRSLH